MRIPIAEKLYMFAAVDVVQTAYSAAVAVEPEGSVELQVTAVAFSGPGPLEVHVEAGNDGENWIEPVPATFISLNTIGYWRALFTGLGYRLVRARYYLSGGEVDLSVCVLAASIEIQDISVAGLAGPGGGGPPVATM